VRGEYPSRLLRAWRDFARSKESENAEPSLYDGEQIFVLVLCGDGGKDLESFDLKSYDESKSMIVQARFSLQGKSF
jgi:hypothetical protein